MTASQIRSELRALAERSVGPVEGAYRRPWMCAGDPAQARVFLVGANAATPFPAAIVDRAAYVDALAHGGDSLIFIYRAVRGDKPSPTRANVEMMSRMLMGASVGPILETNVWSLATRSISELRSADPRTARVTILPDLIEILHPVVVIVHGAAATRDLGRVMRRGLPAASPRAPVLWSGQDPQVVSIPSLSPPPSNAWLTRSTGVLQAMASDIATAVQLRER